MDLHFPVSELQSIPVIIYFYIQIVPKLANERKGNPLALLVGK